MSDTPSEQPIGSRFRLRNLLFILLFLLVIAFVALWIARTSIAENFVKAELDKLDVEASYEIADIGFNRQVIRNLVLGDPDNPDLTAELVEVGNSLTLQGAGINWVRAKNVKLFGELKDGKLSFGELDKFSDPNDTSPLALPDIWVGLENAQVRIGSEFGAVGLSLNGEGNLQNGFAGQLGAVSKELDLAGCAFANPSYYGKVVMNNQRPRLSGPLRLPDMKCAQMEFAAEDLAAQIDITLGPQFDSWDGDIGLVGGPVSYASYRTQEIKTSLTIKGDMTQSEGNIALTASGTGTPYGRAQTARANGPFLIKHGDAQIAGRFEGDLDIKSVNAATGLTSGLSEMAKSAAATPVGPLADKLAGAMQSAGRNFDINSTLTFDTGAKGTTLALDTLDINSRSGAKMALSDPMLLAFTGRNIRMLADGNIRISGGGFPTAFLRMDDGTLARGFSGSLRMAEYASGGARLTVPRLNFAPARGGGTNIDGQIILSGPLADGQITGLQMPISGSLGASGGFALFRQCVDVSYTSLRISSLSTGPTTTRLCPDGGAIVSSGAGGVNLAAKAPSFDLRGKIGGTPLSIATGPLAFSLKRGIEAATIAIRLGAGEDQSRFEMASLTARFGQYVTGTISGGEGKIAAVPLLMNEVEGDWRYDKGVFIADAKLRVRDTEQAERFRPLITQDMVLKFANNLITATGNLLEPTTLTPVSKVDIVHNLANSTGNAQLNVQSIAFTEKFQPELLTPLTLGVVANVDGVISGQGQIKWDNSEDGIQSSGKFRTDGLNLAAAFGPVTGLSGDIEFTDLLALTTAAGQLVRMEEVNPGVAVFNGNLRYRLLPDYKMQIEGGKWPFAGGMLTLEPTVLDLGEEASRRLEFTVEGIDAAQFLSQFEFENLSATGVFDGKLPMIFDQDGGRIAGGYLVAREGGGTLAYVGELSYEDMGAFANFAFNALKSLSYQQLTIGMDGDISGEIITEVKFAGLQQGDTASKNFVTKQLAKLPIEFNVRIQAPFMQLITSAKAYYEPELLVGQNLPALLRAQEARAKEAAQELKEQAR